MKSKIAFSLLLIGCAGTDGNFPVSAVLVLISIFILWKESKKNRRPAGKQKRLLNNTTHAISMLILA